MPIDRSDAGPVADHDRGQARELGEVKEGDTVSAGDVIAEIETDKATMEVEAVDEGTSASILVAEGTEGVAVNTVIAVLLEDGEDASAMPVPRPPESGSGARPEVLRRGEPATTMMTAPADDTRRNARR